MKTSRIVTTTQALSVLLLAAEGTGSAIKEDRVLTTPIPVTTQNAKGLPLDDEGKKRLEFEVQSGNRIAESVKEFLGGSDGIGEYGEL